MNVRITVPSNLDDITVGQFQDIDNLLLDETLKGDELDNEILKVVLNYKDVRQISVKDRNKLAVDVTKALENKGTFKNRFTLNGVEYGLIPNFDKISNGEYTDLIKYYNDVENLHRFLAVAYRPIKNKDKFGNYKIERYKGTAKHADTMKLLPMSIANGVNVFFYNLTNDLEAFILKSTEAEQLRA